MYVSGWHNNNVKNAKIIESKKGNEESEQLVNFHKRLIYMHLVCFYISMSKT